MTKLDEELGIIFKANKDGKNFYQLLLHEDLKEQVYKQTPNFDEEMKKRNIITAWIK